MRLNTVLEIMRYAGDADELTLLQYAIAQAVIDVLHPLAMFDSADAVSQKFQIIAFIRTAGSQPDCNLPNWLNCRRLSSRIDRAECCSSQWYCDRYTNQQQSTALSLSRYLLCPVKHGDEQWFCW